MIRTGTRALTRYGPAESAGMARRDDLTGTGTRALEPSEPSDSAGMLIERFRSAFPDMGRGYENMAVDVHESTETSQRRRIRKMTITVIEEIVE
ncbi:hypothetical protein HA402_011205 [Bradysia odoriphaga]|nr:hypothetical protein HA402_011205 [Bradysia odoriphaga]